MLTPAGGELPERRGRELLERRGVQLGNYLNADRRRPGTRRSRPASLRAWRLGSRTPVPRPALRRHDRRRAAPRGALARPDPSALAIQITAFHDTGASNGPTEAMNNMIKRVKCVAYGFRNFAKYRVRALLYAGRPDWSLLPVVRPR